MKKKIKYWEGFLFGLLLSAIANLITFQDIQLLNVGVGGLLGLAGYYLLGIKS